MKNLEIITGIIVGAIVFAWIAYIVLRTLGRCRDYQDENERIHDRYISSKKGCPRREQQP
jgi:hypothetical protein